MNTANQVDQIIEELKTKDMLLEEKIWLTALANEGQPYVLGAWGALCTPAERRKRFGYNPQATSIKTKCKGYTSGNCTGCQWYPDGQRCRCWDCRGFTDWCLLMWGFDMWGDVVGVQWNTDSNWYIKGKISDGMPENITVCLFKWNGEKFTHTGFGRKGEVCDCSGTVKHSLKRTSTWTHWAVPRCLESDFKLLYPDWGKKPAEEKPVEDGKTNDLPKLQKGDKGDAVRYLQTLLLEHGQKLPKFGVDGDFGNETLKAVKAFQKANGLKQDGIVGKTTWALLTAEPQKKKTYQITVTGLSAEVADEIKAKYGGVITEE